VPKYGGCGINLKEIFQGRKGQIWTFVIYFGFYLGNNASQDQSLDEKDI
jgi:hypothetical protein